MSIPMDTISLCQLIYCFIQDQHLHFVDFLSINFTPHIFLTMALSVLCQIPISFWPRDHVSPPWSIADLTQLLYTIHLILKGNFFLQSKSKHSLNITHPNLVLDVITTTHPPPGLHLLPRYDNSVTVSTSSCDFSLRSSTFLWYPLNLLHLMSISYSLNIVSATKWRLYQLYHYLALSQIACHLSLRNLSISSTIFIASSSSLTPLCMPQFMICPFPLK